MEITVDLSKEEIKTIKDHLVFRMQWIKAKMGEKEPMDFILAKIFSEAEKVEMEVPND